MWIREIRLQGFKSYESRTEIKDMDRSFNSFTGLNGSGKSNVLDAITFALGLLRTKELRASHLQELIYGNGKGKTTKATVVLTLDNHDKENAPSDPNYRNQSKLEIKRLLAVSSKSVESKAPKVENRYFINNASVTREELVRLLSEVQLNIDAATFLIRQGKVTEVIKKKPQELLKLCEESAGTYLFREQSILSQKNIAKLDLEINMYTKQLQNVIRPDLAKKTREHETILRAEARQEELRKAERVVPVKRWQEMDGTLKALKNEDMSLDQTMRNMKQQLEDALRLQALTRQELQELQPEDLRELEQTVVRQQQEHARKQTELNGAESDLQAKQLSIQETAAEVERSENQLSQGNSEFFKQHEQKLKQLGSLKEDLDTTVSLLKSLATGMGDGYSQQVRTQRNRISELRGKIRTAEESLESDITEEQYNAAKAAVAQLEARIADKQQELEGLKADAPASAATGDTAGDQLHELRVRRAQLESKLRSSANLKTELERRDPRLNCSFEGFSKADVLGLVGHLFTLDERAESCMTALETCAGGRLFNVVVRTDEVGQRLLNLKLQRRITVLPLNKIQSYNLGAQKIATAKQVGRGQVDLALDLIRYEPDVKQAMQFVFGSTLIADKSVARDVTFHQGVRARTITPEGDVYEPSGTLTGGFVERSSSKLKSFEDWNQCEAKCREVEGQLREVIAQLRELESGADAAATRQRQIKARANELNALQEKLQNDASARTVKRYSQHLAGLEATTAQIAEHRHELAQAEERLAQLQRDQAEFSRDQQGKLAEYRERETQQRGEVDRLQQEVSRSSAEYERLSSTADTLRHKIQVGRARIEQWTGELAGLKTDVSRVEEALERLGAALTTQQAELEMKRAIGRAVQEQIGQKQETLRACAETIETSQMQQQQCQQRLEKTLAEEEKLQTKINRYSEIYPWLLDPSRYAGREWDWRQVPEARFKELEAIIAQKADIEGAMLGVDLTVQERIRDTRELVTSNEGHLQTLGRNKAQILSTAEKIERQRENTIRVVQKRVSEDMKRIFSMFLPGSECWLVFKNDENVHEGLEFRVKIGNQIKHSVSELSGGQKSLVGLSFTFAMLKYSPAPVYLLDEVDAALDDNHTQNLGKIINKEFKQAQFILVSLKDSLYMSGNKVYHVTNHNGKSVVQTVSEMGGRLVR